MSAGGLRFTGCLSLACGPETADEVPPDAAERYATAMCGTYERCGCLGEWFVDVAECRAVGIETFRLVEDWPKVRFDKECFDDVLEYLEADACETVTSDTWKPLPCLVFEGTIARGEPCTPLAALALNDAGGGGGLADDSCADGGICVDGRCQAAPGPSVGLGESCVLELGAACDPLHSGLYCAPDGRCHEQAALNEACDAPHACEDNRLYCAGLTENVAPGTCAPQIPSGGSCDPEEVRSCDQVSESFCSAAGICAGPWPQVCAFLTPAPGAFFLGDWVPLH